jgi:hypothetical protein
VFRSNQVGWEQAPLPRTGGAPARAEGSLPAALALVKPQLDLVLFKNFGVVGVHHAFMGLRVSAVFL